MNLEKICLTGIDVMALILILASIAIYMGIMKNPYTTEEIQVAALTALAMTAHIQFHRLAEKN